MAIRTIDAPGIEIHEIDKSQYSPAMTGTKVLVTGFANSGEDYIPMIFTSKSAWLNYYGEPGNEAERYFYAASMEVLNQNGVVNCCKLPYENEARDKFVGFKYKLFTTDPVMLSTAHQQISHGGKLYQMGQILDNSTTYHRDLLQFFASTYNVSDSEDKEKITNAIQKDGEYGVSGEISAGAQGILSCQVNTTDRADGLSEDDVNGKDFCDLYALSTFNQVEEAFRKQITKSDILKYAKELDLVNAGIEPKLPIFWSQKTETVAAGEAPAITSDFNYSDVADEVDVADIRENVTKVSTISSTLIGEISPNAVKNVFMEMYTGLKSIANLVKDNSATAEKYAGLTNLPIIGDSTDSSNISAGTIVGALTDLLTIADNGSGMTITEDYFTDLMHLVYGQVRLYNDLVANGATQNVVQNEKGYVHQDIGIIIPYLVSKTDVCDGTTTTVNKIEYKKFDLQNYYDLPEDTSKYNFVVDKLNSLHNFDYNTEGVEDDGLYVSFDSTPSLKSNTIIGENNGLHLVNYEEMWMRITDYIAIDDDTAKARISSMVENQAYDMGNEVKDFDQLEVVAQARYKAYNENAEVLKDDFIKTIKDTLMFSEIRQADDTIDCAWKIAASGAPVLFEMAQIDEYRTDESRVGTNQILVVDKTRKPYGKVPEDKNHKNDGRELIGVIPIITTAANALYAQSMINVDKESAIEYETIHNVHTLDSSTQPYTFLGQEYKTHNIMEEGTLSATSIISQRFNNVHTDEDNDDDFFDSLALEANNYFSSIALNPDGGFDRENMKKIGLVVVKAFLDATEGNKISFQTVESFVGSLDRDEKNPNTGATVFIDTLVNEQSEYVNIFTNCMPTDALKEKYKKTVDILVMPHETADVASMGFYEGQVEEDIDISESILKGLDTVFEKVTDINERDIDIVVDGGISNIAQFIKSVYGKKGFYDPASPDATLWKCKKDNDVKMWKTVVMKLDNFCKNVRKDCMFIADGPRPYCLQGQKKIVRPSKPTNTIDANILPFTKYLTGINTSYGAGYCDWFQIADEFSGDYFWCPPSIKACGVYIYTDLNFQYWDAPAGLNRGIVAALDVAFSPTNKQAGQIYTKNWNYAINYPQDGIVLEGQKTLQSKPSALDRVNVRRLMLRLERATYKVLRYVVYEGNTAYLRQRVVDLLDPYFKEAKVGGGLYDYKIICDESNNTPTTIDRNELHISIGVKPVKTIEFIICNFVLLSTGASWDEM